MARHEEMPWEYPNDYERAICYYTLPKVIHPVTYGLILAYAVCLFEAFAALCIGVIRDSRVWTVSGAVAVAAIVIFGCLAFTIRALLNEVRQKKALAEAAPAPRPEQKSYLDIPDPFENHVLYKWSPHYPNRLYCCQGNEATTSHRLERGDGKKTQRMISLKEGEAPFLIESLKGVASFVYGPGMPRKIQLRQDDQIIGQILRPRFFRLEGKIFLEGEAEPRYLIKEGAFYWSEQLLGRFYTLRGAHYLDIDSAHAHPAILAYFVTEASR